MALHFELGKINNFDEVCAHPADHDKMNPVTDSVIWATMSVDMGEITEKNVDEFWFRVRLLQLVHGPELRAESGPVCLTRDDIALHVGLRTNVRTRTRRDWLVRQFGPKAHNDKIAKGGTQTESAHAMLARLHAESKT